jgi:glycosyltransferase involved in cell wall biosynthesis
MQLLERAAISVLAQTHENLEVVIVDDQSTDSTGAVIEKLARSDSRVKPVRANEKMYNAARNYGLKFATGEIVAFLDDDDVWAPEKIAAQIPHLENYPIVGCREKKFGNKDKAMKCANKEVTLKDFYWSNRGLNPSSIVVKREVIEAVGGFDPDLKGAGGMSFIARALGAFGVALVLGKSLVLRDQSHGFERVTGTNAWLAGCWKEYSKNYELRSRAQRQVRSAQLDLYTEIASGEVKITSLARLWLRGMTWQGFFRWHSILTRLGLAQLRQKYSK